MDESFYIKARLYGDDRVTELLVIPSLSSVYQVMIDGKTVTQVFNNGEFWEQINGTLDLDSISKITTEIENHYI
ncbi:MAG: hypothetical protein K0S09_1906 [Sphingobacteriaceae bacterium]|jgi:hypothetical protein|nr:hypothetical protein [Sphingobacteriaceae bacterium]